MSFEYAKGKYTVKTSFTNGNSTPNSHETPDVSTVPAGRSESLNVHILTYNRKGIKPGSVVEAFNPTIHSLAFL